MKISDTTADVGVVIGRFEVHRLHSEHTKLLQAVADAHDKVIIILGLSPLKTTKKNPLDFQARQQMILKSFPNFTVIYENDVPSNEVWSKNIDKKITDLTTASQTAVIYGSRDSFIESYSGKYPTQELLQEVYVSGTEERRGIGSKSTKASEEFREGVIWATQNRFPTAYHTVDIAIFDKTGTRLLLGQKPGETQWRFVGGFLDPIKDNSTEDGARREVKEETGATISDLTYICSQKIDDWRYRNEEDKIITSFFTATHASGDLEPGDDIAYIRWFTYSELTEDVFVQAHWPLWRRLIGAKPQSTIDKDEVK